MSWRELGPDPEVVSTDEKLREHVLELPNPVRAVEAAAAFSVARDAWLERRYSRDLLADVPNDVEPETGLRVHDLFEWERIFEDEDTRRAERSTEWRRSHGEKPEEDDDNASGAGVSGSFLEAERSAFGRNAE
jgi:hypothetical protein